jgi:hypothetical protein
MSRIEIIPQKLNGTINNKMLIQLKANMFHKICPKKNMELKREIANRIVLRFEFFSNVPFSNPA